MTFFAMFDDVHDLNKYLTEHTDLYVVKWQHSCALSENQEYVCILVEFDFKSGGSLTEYDKARLHTTESHRVIPTDEETIIALEEAPEDP